MSWNTRKVLRLVARLREYLLFDETRGIRLAPGLKRRFFSEVTVYRRVDDRDVLYSLTYEPQALRRLHMD